jgi:polyribonucleotide nucleotidyltransferase
MHFYVFAPFSTGETGRVGAPGRREIGHGALAEKALVPVLPSKEEFPYTVSLVSEVLSSNGSTSMASTCGSTLALMDAGVPIKAPVGGIAMGVVVEDKDNYSILTDIMGLEDFNGDMDFKIAGSKKGITALQLDVKTLDLSLEMLEKAIEQSKPARMQVLETIASAITEPRSKVSNYAPKVKTISIPVDKIGELIGPGGKNIKKIMADTKAQLDVNDDGTVTITAVDEAAVDAAFTYIEGMTKEVQAGEIYEGTVQRILPFGAFVEVLPGKEGLVHVSDMKEEFVSDPNEVVAIGDKVQVRVKEVDDMGRINLSMNMDPSKDKTKEDRGSGGGFGGGDRGPRRSFDGGGERRGGFGGDRRSGGNDRGPRRSFGGPSRGNFSGPRRDGGNRSEGGPHFPVSRYLDSPNQKDSDR